RRGARSFLLKPLENDALNELLEDIVSFSDKQNKKVLVGEDNEVDSSQITKILQGDNIDVTLANTGKKHMQETNIKEYDCIILDYTLPDISGIDLVNQVSDVKKKLTPVIVYSAKDFDKKELHHLNRSSNTILLKGVNSLEHLLEETILQLHINHKD